MKETPCVLLEAGGYRAVISPETGASVLRLQYLPAKAEIFRYREEVSMDEISSAREIWGLPTLYLPNRFNGGVLKTSDGEYHFPVNETKLGNYIHGFVHKRKHELVSLQTDADSATAVTRFVFDQTDEMYAYFPLDFTISYRFRLSENGLEQEITLTSHAKKALPVSLCTHTCINAPVFANSAENNLRLSVPIVKKCELNERCLPTERLLDVNDWDKEYLKGKMPTLQVLDNDMYTAGMNALFGEPFEGAVIEDLQSGMALCNEVSPEFRFWNMWNHDGDKGYFCPEPMTAMINAPNLSLPQSVTGYAELQNGESFTCWQRFFIRMPQ